MKIYFKNVDFLRFLLCIGVIIQHFHNTLRLQSDFINIPIYKVLIENNLAFIPVDCFFIISGFFLFLTTDVKTSIYNFIKKRYIRLMPTIIFATVITIVVSSILTHSLYMKWNDIWALFMLQNVGFSSGYATLGVDWYISVLFWSSCLLFYLYKIMDKKWFNVIMVCFVFVFYILYKNILPDQSPVISTVCKVFNFALIRSLAGISLGYFICQIYQDLIKPAQKNDASILAKILYTIAEGSLLFIVFVNVLYKNFIYNNHILIIFMFAILFTLFIMKKGYISNLFDNNFSRHLGKYTYSIYITHILIRNLWRYFITENPAIAINYPILNVSVILISIFVFGIFTYHFVEKPATKFLTEKFCK